MLYFIWNAAIAIQKKFIRMAKNLANNDGNVESAIEHLWSLHYKDILKQNIHLNLLTIRCDTDQG